MNNKKFFLLKWPGFINLERNYEYLLSLLKIKSIKRLLNYLDKYTCLFLV